MNRKDRRALKYGHHMEKPLRSRRQRKNRKRRTGGAPEGVDEREHRLDVVDTSPLVARTVRFETCGSVIDDITRAYGAQMSAALNALIRDVAQSMPGEATPREIAVAVVDKYGDELMREFLPELVTTAVYQIITASRNATLNNSPATRSGRDNRSPRVAAKRDWWNRLVNERTPVGENEYKLLGDCSAADLEHCIAVRESQREALAEQIGKYRKLIDAMNRFACDTVSDLSPELVDL